jgi:tripartite-type tricarboxylate transporter receptor subunit TctC
MRKLIGLLAVVCWCAVWPAAAEDYPSRPIRAITATSPGGTSDVYMRVLGEELRKAWGQAVVVDNRPGGGLNIGGRFCAEAAPDGYTICILPTETLTYNEFLYRSIPFKPERDFVPVANPFFATQVLVVNSSLGVKSLADLAALAKAKPKTLSYVTPSVSLYVYMENWKKQNRADIVWVPFKGGGDAVNGLLNGVTPIAFFGLANMIQYIRSGQLTALAVDGDKRSPLLPDVPTVRELGYKGPLTQVYFGIVAPKGTPPAIVEKLSKEINRIDKEPEFRQKRLIELGLEPVEDTPAQFAQFLTADRARAKEIVKDSGLPPR